MRTEDYNLNNMPEIEPLQNLKKLFEDFVEQKGKYPKIIKICGTCFHWFGLGDQNGNCAEIECKQSLREKIAFMMNKANQTTPLSCLDAKNVNTILGNRVRYHWTTVGVNFGLQMMKRLIGSLCLDCSETFLKLASVGNTFHKIIRKLKKVNGGACFGKMVRVHSTTKGKREAISHSQRMETLFVLTANNRRKNMQTEIEKKKCPACGGSGLLDVPHYVPFAEPLMEQETCPVCNGEISKKRKLSQKQGFANGYA